MNIYEKSENRYKTRLSTKYPVVIRFDGKNTGKYEIDTLSLDEGSYLWALKETIRDLSKKYIDAIVYGQGDEINLVFLNPKPFKQFDYSTQKISSLFGQEIFYIFNKYYTKQEIKKSDNFEIYDIAKSEGLLKKVPIFFDTRSFSILPNSFRHYVFYRFTLARNYRVSYMIKSKGINSEVYLSKTLKEKENILKQFGGIDLDTFSPEQKNGILGFRGSLIGLSEKIEGPSDPLLKYLYSILKDDMESFDDSYLLFF